MQGVPQQPLEDALADYRAQLETYLDSQAPEATVGEVLGTQNIKTVIHKQLAAGLPYELATRKLVVSELSDNLRWKFRYQLFTSQYGRQGSQLISVERPTAALAGRKLALSFKPASQEDEETLASYLPGPDENGEIDPNQIPGTLPGYLIDLTGEFAIGNEEVVLASSNTAMGTGLQSEMGYWQPNRGWQTSRNEPVAGEYRALALNLQGISQSQAKALQSDLENTQEEIEAENFSSLTKKMVVGDTLYSNILSYLAFNDGQDTIAEKQAQSVGYRAPSYGLFKTTLTPQYWYGVARNVAPGGLNMDVDKMSSIRVDRDNNHQRWVSFNRARGARMSAMEHLVPEQMYSSEGSSVNGISAVKAIHVAAAEGQKIWTITQANLDQAMASLDLSSETMNDIRNSVRAGKEVSAHERPVSFFGRQFEGYIVLDPQRGAGAYLIGSGENGAEIFGGMAEGFSVGGLLSEGVGRLLQSRFLFSLGKAILGPIANVMQLVANIFQVLDSCLRSGAGSLKTFAVMVVVVSLTVLFIMTIAQIGFVMPGLGNLIAWFLVERFKAAVSSAISSIGC